MTDLVLISKHKKGFWQADFYKDGTDVPAESWDEIGVVPDGFFTMKKGQSVTDAMHKAKTKWPAARIDLIS